jgi:RimJ/RimL family protein N-acetyltransferase
MGHRRNLIPSSAAEGFEVAKVVIPTANLDLVLQTPDEVLASIEAMPPADRAEVSPDWLARVRATPAGDPWALSFSVVERGGGAIVGSCGFKGPPDADGVVELAYGIDTSRRGRGFATEAAGALARFAFASSRVRLVLAHTKPGNGASERVLAKCGFRQVGMVVDPEDGLVCRWEQRHAEPGSVLSSGDS